MHIAPTQDIETVPTAGQQTTHLPSQHQITKDTTPLRFITCGSVDDGKSTLIGRLLWDTKAVFDDQVEGTKPQGSGQNDGLNLPDFANLLDGLQAEREQGITIDVAYRYFATQNRSFIVADTPGHQQYTRNMATGASTADLAVLLIDARAGILEQTRRHATIVSLMGITQVILVINKIDLVDYDKDHYDNIVTAFKTFSKPLGFQSLIAIPTSAIKGENVALAAPQNMPWYQGKTLLQTLELATKRAPNSVGFRFPVQRVCRPDESFRGYQGTIAGGAIKPGDSVTILPSGETANVKKIVTFDLVRNAGVTGDAVTLVLDRQVDIARGDMIVSMGAQPLLSQQFDAKLIVLDDHGLDVDKTYWLKANNRRQKVKITLKSILNLQTSQWNIDDKLTTNSIAKVALQFSSNAVFDSYSDNRETGSFILIDPDNNNTAAGGMIISKIDNVIPLDTKTDRKDILYRMPDDIAFKFTQTEFYKTNLEWIKTENEGGEP